MLVLKNIVKDYEVTKDEIVNALKGVSITFRESEFVSILGQSGCGKTTLLNIIGGLDRYTTGDLIINGKSTKKYTDRDWDDYRNHSIGFVFQSYNLIPHQNVLSNVELALTLSGVSKKERRKKAIEALERVGLKDQIYKRPNQMSGGQMQRVAIARALVNNPDILLADEPTGALDSQTSIQVMRILKEVSKNKLVIMVTHNSEIAYEYSTRIIKLKDGLVKGDSNPYIPSDKRYDYKEIEGIKIDMACPRCSQKITEVIKSCPKCGLEFTYPKNVFSRIIKNKKKPKRGKKPSMSFFTALALSFNNLLTKFGRTILTSFAGSIGIIGIALILSLSTGFQNYINKVQEDTLSAYPVSIQKETADLGAILETFTQEKENNSHNVDENTLYTNSTLIDVIKSLSTKAKNDNDLEKFKAYIEQDENKAELRKYVSAITYGYNLDLSIYSYSDGKTNQVNPSPIMNSLVSSISGASSMMSSSGTNIFGEILPGLDGEFVSNLVMSQYDVIKGDWPKKENEMILIVNKNNEISALAAYALGLKDSTEFYKILQAAFAGEEYTETSSSSWSFDDIIGMTYKLVLPTDCYYFDEVSQTYKKYSSSSATFVDIVKNSPDVKIVGIVRPKEGATGTALSGSVGYTSLLMNNYINKIHSSSIVVDQLENKGKDIFTGMDFPIVNDRTKESQIERLISFVDTLNNAQLSSFYENIKELTIEQEATLLLNQQLQNPMTKAMLALTVKQALSSEEYADNAYAKDIKDRLDSGDLTDEKLLDEPMIRTIMIMMIESRLRENYANISSADKRLELKTIFNTNTDLTEDYYDTYKDFVSSNNGFATLESNLHTLGYVDLDSPDSINLYPISFEDKDHISDFISEYNSSVSEEQQISYTDYIGLLLSGVTTIVDAVSYVLIGFVSISLVVSSIMIGIITYISVLERTKEIGVLRSVGASKKDIRRVFNAETLIVGLTSGLLGIGVTALINIPISLIVQNLTEIKSLASVLPWYGAIGLVLISIFLTTIAGLIPSNVAAKKDPVIALRTE